MVQPFSLQIDPQAQDRILIFARELMSWNDRFNLLSRSDAPNVIRKHVAASLGVFLVAPPSPWDRWIDVGTGAGFPGLVLKMVQPSLDMTLVDSARKRCLFIENTVRTMGLGRVPVWTQRVETLIAHGSAAAQFSVLTARAVAALDESIASFGPLLRVGGRVVTFKGPQWKEELDTATESGVLDKCGFVLESSTRIPWTAGHLLCLRKIKAVQTDTPPSPTDERDDEGLGATPPGEDLEAADA
jgi:16S rRNA (guanine527-N7)-methyltransferase